MKKYIDNCLKSDNTNISLIYESLCLLNKFDDKKEISYNLNKFKFCLPNELNNGLININKVFQQNNIIKLKMKMN